MSREPLWSIGVITSVIGALITLLVTFGVPISDAQQNALNQFLIVIAPLIMALVGRNYTTPVSDPKAVNEAGKLVDLTPADGSQLPVKG